MIVLSEVVDSLPLPTRNPGIDLAIETATLLEVWVHPLSHSQPSQNTGDATALANIPDCPTAMPGIWIGETPTVSHYEAVYAQALQHGIWLLNTPQEHRTLYDAKQLHTALQELMPASAVISDVSHCEAAIAQLGLPISVRGETPFNPLSPHATTLEELQHLVAPLLQQPRRLLRQGNSFAPPNNVILQSVVPLRSYLTPIGMRLGRIFRVVLYRQTLITYGYAWAGDHFGRYLSTPEEEALLNVVFRAIARINAPFVSLDVGQLETEDWIVLGTGDPQFTATEQIPWIQFWQAMRESVR